MTRGGWRLRVPGLTELRRREVAARPRSTSPEPPYDASLDPAWSPTVLRRQQAVHLLAAELRAARTVDPSRPLAELLPLVKQLHDARLDHAAALLAAGGEVTPDLRRELVLRAARRQGRPVVPRAVRART